MEQGTDRYFHSSMALSLAELDFQLSPSLSAKDALGVLDQMIAQTSAAKSAPAIVTTSDIIYGGRARQRLDLFRPVGATAPLPGLIFIHGGFWQEGDKSVSGFAATSFTDMGWVYISVGYTLTPEVTLSDVVDEVHDAIAFVHANAPLYGIDPERIVVVGHSAGAHLAASVLSGISQRDSCPPLAGAVLVSGVYELAPISKSYVSNLTPMDAGDVVDLSPLRYGPEVMNPIHVLIGSDEPQAFQAQSEALHAVWVPLLRDMSYHVAPGRDHFDVLFELTDPASPTVARILSMV